MGTVTFSKVAGTIHSIMSFHQGFHINSLFVMLHLHQQYLLYTRSQVIACNDGSGDAGGCSSSSGGFECTGVLVAVLVIVVVVMGVMVVVLEVVVYLFW